MMFSAEDKKYIHRDYFEIINDGDTVVELQSPHGDWWLLAEQEHPVIKGQTSYALQRKDNRYGKYQTYGEYDSVFDAVLEIVDADDYMMKTVGRTRYEEFLDEAGLLGGDFRASHETV